MTPRLVTVLAACLLPLGVADARPRTGHSASSSFDSTPVVLQSFHGAHADMDVALIPCNTHDCAIQVRLFQGGAIVDRFPLPASARLIRIKAEKVDEDWGADPGLTAWRSGFETDYVATAARLISLAPGTTGLLVTQRSNIQPIHRQHLLLVARRGKLRVIWQTQETTGWSATEVIRGAAGTQDLAYFQLAGEGPADRYVASRLHWDASQGKFMPSPLPDPSMPLYVLSLNRYESPAKAREARTMFSFCLASFWALDANGLPGHSQGVVGKIYTHRPAAEIAARQVKTCLPDLKTSILPWIVEPPPVEAPPPKSTAPAPHKRAAPRVPGPPQGIPGASS